AQPQRRVSQTQRRFRTPTGCDRSVLLLLVVARRRLAQSRTVGACRKGSARMPPKRSTPAPMAENLPRVSTGSQSGRKAGNKVGRGGESSHFWIAPDWQFGTAADWQLQIQADRLILLSERSELRRGQTHDRPIATIVGWKPFLSDRHGPGQRPMTRG